MEALFEQINQLISRTVGSPGQAFTAGQFSGLGWLEFHYVCSTYDGPYPRIALKQYDKTVNFYIHVWDNGQSILENYKEVFGKSAVGVGCIRIRKLNEQRIEALRELVQIAMNTDNG